MSRKRDTFKLGIAVTLMFALLVTSLLFIGSSGLFQPEQTEILVRFFPGSTMPDISEGSYVTYFGQKVGTVSSSKFIEDANPQDPEVEDYHFLEVRAAVRADLKLREDCTIVAAGPPLGGKGSLNIITRGDSTALLEPDEPVYAQVWGFQAAIDMISKELDETNPDGLLARIKLQLDVEDQSSLLARIHNSLKDINTVTASLSREFNREIEGMLLAKVHKAVDGANIALSELDELVVDNRPKFNRFMSSMEHSAATLDSEIISVLAHEFELDETPVLTLLTKLHSALDNLNFALADLNVASAGAKEMVVLNKDRVAEIVENTGTASMHLKHGIRDLSLHPWRLLEQPSDGEKRELYLFDVAREFAVSAAHLDDATSRLTALLDASGGQVPMDDPDLLEIRSELQATIQRFVEAEHVLWKELKAR